MTRNLVTIFLTALLAVIAFSGVAHAAKLEINPNAPAWAQLGASILLYVHIGGGSIGILSGATAIASRKGEIIHRTAGKIFFVSMFITYAIGASVAPFLSEGQRPNFVAGVLALYLLITGWQTARGGKIMQAGRAQMIGLAVALTITGLGILFMRMAANSPTGTIDGSPSEAFLLFTIAGSAAVAGELNALIRRNLSGAARIARHLWRMCVSLFIAAGSLFLGQPQIFPDWFNASLFPYLLAFSPLIAMLFWLVAVRF